MAKRTSYDIKREILLNVRENPATYAQLERKVNTGFRSIKANCEELEDFGQVNIERKARNPANGKPYHVISITRQGLDLLKKKK